MPITSLRFTNAGPFDDITFEFDRQVNVFTGPNNSGKSTALHMLAEICVFPVGIPRKLLKTGRSQWGATLSSAGQERWFDGEIPIEVPADKKVMTLLTEVGFTTFVPALRRSTDYRSDGPSIHSRNRAAFSIGSPGERSPGNDELTIDGQRKLANSLERLFGGAESIEPELRKRHELIATDATMVSDESVIRRMIDLDYAAYRQGKPHIRQLIEQVASIASEVTDGFPVEFLRVGQDEQGLFPEFKTPDGILPLNVLSQGTQSIIQWLAQFLFGYAQYYDYPENLAEKPGILLVDEIDAHLHPSWQRRILPALTGHFPNLQIFCSTHSPLMLAGLKEGQVQLLRRDANGQVTVSRNETDIIGWSAEEILRSILGVRDTTDLTTASEIDRMGELIVKETLTEEERAELEELRQRVGAALPGGPASSQMESFARFLNEVYAKPEPHSSSAGRKRPRVSRRNAGAE